MRSEEREPRRNKSSVAARAACWPLLSEMCGSTISAISIPYYIGMGDSHNPTSSQRPIVPLHGRHNGNRTTPATRPACVLDSTLNVIRSTRLGGKLTSPDMKKIDMKSTSKRLGQYMNKQKKIHANCATQPTQLGLIVLRTQVPVVLAQAARLRSTHCM